MHKITRTPLKKNQVVQPVYFSNWGDVFGVPLAYQILPFINRVSWISPNMITITSFLLYVTGSVLLFIQVPFHLLFAALLLPLAFLLDDLDGPLARGRGQTSYLGDYLDKVLDVLKIYILTASLSLAVYQHTRSALAIFLGFTACFFFMYRYYIKLEAMFQQIGRTGNYLRQSQVIRQNLVRTIERERTHLSKTFAGRIKCWWLIHRIIFWVDEAEFALFTAVGALFNRLELVLWILTLSQVTIAVWRFGQRSQQIQSAPEELLQPLRK